MACIFNCIVCCYKNKKQIKHILLKAFWKITIRKLNKFYFISFLLKLSNFRQYLYAYLLTLKKTSDSSANLTKPSSHLSLAATDIIKNSWAIKLKLILNTTLGKQNTVIYKSTTEEERKLILHCRRVPQTLTWHKNHSGRCSVCISKSPKTLSEFVISSILCCSIDVCNSHLWKYR